MSSCELRRTPLYHWHKSHGAHLAEFAGWEMPLWYNRVTDEVKAVRQAAGLFDVSHMGELELSGSGALATVQYVATNDARRLQEGQAQYSLLCTEHGGVLDDILVYRLAENRFLLCVNAANSGRDFHWIQAHKREAAIVDRSEEFSLLALQGPRSTAILSRLAVSECTQIRRFHARPTRILGYSVLLARTGYTGEDGWEIFCSPEAAEPLWLALLEAGASAGLRPAGLAARDLLRLEAALPLYGHELNEEVTPLEAGLAWAVRFEKEEFVGRQALWELAQRGVTRKLAGMVLTEPGIPRQGYPIVKDGTEIGVVTSGGKSPTLGKSIALGYLAPAFAVPGETVHIDVRGCARAAQVVERPFYQR